MPIVKMYSTITCPFCIRAEHYLLAKGVSSIQKIMLENNPAAMQEMIRTTGRRSVPQIFIGEIHLGGFDDLVALDREGKLEPLLDV